MPNLKKTNNNNNKPQMIYKSSNYKQQKNIADNRQIPLQKIINKQTQYKKIKKASKPEVAGKHQTNTHKLKGPLKETRHKLLTLKQPVYSQTY